MDRIEARVSRADLPVYFINLDRSPDRRAFMEQQFARLGMHAERVTGLDGACGKLPAWLAAQFPTASQLTPGEVGCYASHLATLSKIAAAKHEAAIVLEDDATLSPDFIEVTRGAIAAAPAGWDVLHFSAAPKQPRHVVKRFGSSALVRYSRLPVGSAAYAVSLKGAQKLMAERMRVRPFDMEFRYAWLMGLDVCGVDPPPAAPGIFFATTTCAPRKSGRAIKRNWSPGWTSQLYGMLYRTRALGLSGTIHCWRAKGGASMRKRALRLRRKTKSAGPA
jgi:glycosyl transferase, family 25